MSKKSKLGIVSISFNGMELTSMEGPDSNSLYYKELDENNTIQGPTPEYSFEVECEITKEDMININWLVYCKDYFGKS